MTAKSDENVFYITTAIDYSNAIPHLGHAFEKIGADVIARYQKLLGKDVYFLTGTDEHSQNVKRKAAEEGIDPKAYCDRMAEKFKQVWQALNIDYSNFIQTTDPTHATVVQTILSRMYEKDDIYKDAYKGKYCASCEKFLNTDDLVDEIMCKVHDIKVENVEEENYFFKLKKYQTKLLNHIKKNPGFIQPESRRNEILSLLEKGLEDVSISREGTDWGIPLPFDTNSMTYVWVDALINYISGLGGFEDPRYEKYWPADLHVIGKDITRFHCVIWPCMLMSADIALPKEIWGHGFVHMDGAKMSKTKGTGINPMELANAYGTDTLRYFLMREIAWDRDGEFDLQRLIERHNSELSNGVGNVVSRVHKMVLKYGDGHIEKPKEGASYMLVGIMHKKISSYMEAMNTYNLASALDICHEIVREVDLHLDQHKPWKLAKDPDKMHEVMQILFESVTCVIILAVCLSPFCPNKMPLILKAFDLDPTQYLSKHGLDQILNADHFKATTPFEPIFPRIESEE